MASLPEMLRVAVPIGAGGIKPSTILRRLATYSRKSKLYFAFREHGLDEIPIDRLREEEINVFELQIRSGAALP